MNKPKIFSKLNRKGKLILGFMAVAIASPIILAACGSNSVIPNSMLGEKEALDAASLLLGYKQNNKNAIFTSIEQMENFYYTGNVDTKKPENSSSGDSSSSSMTPASKASIFSSQLFYYAVPGNPADPNSKLFYEGEMKVMKKLSEITNNKFTDISLLSVLGSNILANLSNTENLSSLVTSAISGTLAFNVVAAHWWQNNYAGLQKRVQEDFASYKHEDKSNNKTVNLLPNLKVLLAPNNGIAQFLLESYINAYGKHLADVANKSKFVISTGWGL